MKTPRIAFLLLALATGFPACAEEGWTVSAGMEQSTGKYGSAESTDIAFYPVTVRYRRGRGVAALTLSQVRITGPDNVVALPGAGPLSIPGRRQTQRKTQRKTVSGPGDTVATGSWNLIENAAAGWLVDLTGKAKFGTADSAKGLGTGENDYSLQVDALLSAGRGMLFGSLGGRRMGDPDGVDLMNPWFASLGADFPLSPTVRAGVGYDFRQRIAEGNEPLSELTAFMTWAMSRDVRLQGYLIRGFTTASPDRGTGLSLTWRF